MVGWSSFVDGVVVGVESIDCADVGTSRSCRGIVCTPIKLIATGHAFVNR